MDYQIKIEDIGAQRVAAVVRQVPISQVGAFIGEAFGLVMAALEQQQIEPSGPPFARYQMLGDPWEVYLDGPEVAEPRTIVRVPCRPVG